MADVRGFVLYPHHIYHAVMCAIGVNERVGVNLDTYALGAVCK